MKVYIKNLISLLIILICSNSICSQHIDSKVFEYQEISADSFFKTTLNYPDSIKLNNRIIKLRWWPDTDSLTNPEQFLKRFDLLSKIVNIHLEYYDYDFIEESEHMAIFRMKKILSKMEQIGNPGNEISAILFHSILTSEERDKYLYPGNMGDPDSYLKIIIRKK